MNQTNQFDQAFDLEQSPKQTLDDKWVIAKNIPKYNLKDLKNLNEEEVQEYKKINKMPQKAGYYLEIKKFSNFYRISFYDFLPFFIGSFITLFKLFIAYGDVKHAIRFDRKIYVSYVINFIICLIFAFFLYPLVLLVLLVFFPFIVLGASEVSHMINELNFTSNAFANLNMLVNLFLRLYIGQLLTADHIALTLVVWFLISLFNLQTFVFYFLFNFNKKYIYNLERNKTKKDLVTVIKKLAV